MSRILVAGTEPNAGATTVAVGLAHRLAYAGRAVRLERLAGDTRAQADAQTFSLLEFAAATGRPLDEAGLPADTSAVTVIEAPAGADAVAIAQRLGARLVLVSTQAAAAPAGATVILNRQRTAGALALAEDRLLAAPTVGRLIEASGAQVLSRSEEGDAAICEHLVVAAISHDAADAYYSRFPRRAVVCRAERVDLALAAMLTGSDVLVLTGGVEPSPYLLDRAAATRSTTLLLAPERTVETVRDIEGLFGSSPFSHEAKVERAGALLAAALDDATLGTLVG
ncbi:MAG: DRTGG domain-containing protein [Dehalococcoidia bacterium]|nr:DRTGG domain-containing protein [Dehalococcoidia bacterium]